MAGTTTYYGISYPTSTDYVKDGATAMQTIADGFDSAVAIPTYNNQTGTSYTFVLTDAGKTVTSNNASAVTFTIPPQASVAWANNTTLTLRNLGAGVVTIAGGAGVTVTNTAQTVAQYGEVKLIRTASNAWTVVPASGGAGGLVLLNTTSFTTSSGVIVDGCFSSTYDNYKITLYTSAASATVTDIYWYGRSGSPASDTTTNYNRNTFSQYSTSLVGNNQSVPTLGYVTTAYPNHTMISCDLFKPNIATRTLWCSDSQLVNQSGQPEQIRITGYHDVNTQFTGIKILPGSGTFSGVLSIYGYAK